HTRFDCDWSSDVCSSDLHSSRNRRNLSGVARRIVVTALEQVIGETKIAANRTGLVAIDLALDMRIFCGGRLRGEICRIRLAQLRTPSPRLGPPENHNNTA